MAAHYLAPINLGLGLLKNLWYNVPITTKEVKMDTFKKILNVLTKNIGYTVVLVLAIILFALFSDGLISGIITAVSAMIGYTCVDILYKEYKKLPNSKKK